MRRAAIAILGLVAALHATAPAGAQPVDLLLVLAVDGSGSIDEEEFRFQREGYAAALTHPQVLRAIRSGERRAIGSHARHDATLAADVEDRRRLTASRHNQRFGIPREHGCVARVGEEDHRSRDHRTQARDAPGVEPGRGS